MSLLIKHSKIPNLPNLNWPTTTQQAQNHSSRRRGRLGPIFPKHLQHPRRHREAAHDVHRAEEHRSQGAAHARRQHGATELQHATHHDDAADSVGDLGELRAGRGMMSSPRGGAEGWKGVDELGRWTRSDDYMGIVTKMTTSTTMAWLPETNLFMPC